MTHTERCKLATDCLPEAEYRRRLEALHFDMLGEIDRFRAALGRAHSALELIAAAPRPDGTFNRDREACRHLALQVLHRARQDGEHGC